MSLQNSKIFSCILIVSVTGITAILVGISCVRGNMETLTSQNWYGKGFDGVIITIKTNSNVYE